MYPTLNAQKTTKTGNGGGGAGSSAVAVSGFAAPRDAASIAAAAPAPAAAARSGRRKLSGGFAAGFYGATSKSSYSPSTGTAKAASTNNNRKVKAGRKLEAALGMYPTLNAQKASIASKSAASSSAAPVAVSGFAAPRNVPAPAPAPAKH